MNVTVDYEDLEALLFATGAIKDVESAIKGRDRDPLAKSAASRLTAAHDRVAAAWRRAKREPPPEPSVGEVEELRRMFTGPDGARLSEAITDTYPQNFAQHLLLVESGPIWEGVKIDWPAPSTPEFRPSGQRMPRYGVRLTVLGEKVLAEVPPNTVTTGLPATEGDGVPLQSMAHPPGMLGRVVYETGTLTGEAKAHIDRLLAESFMQTEAAISKA